MQQLDKAEEIIKRIPSLKGTGTIAIKKAAKEYWIDKQRADAETEQNGE